MKDFLQRIEKLSPKRLALLAVEQQARLEALTLAQREPIAIIGMGCRFPGNVDSPESFWNLLSGGRDAITEIPPERFDVNALYDPDPASRGKISSRFGGFVQDADKFDASFFGISRREAVTMDPQQRLLLETSWEALERAAISPRSLAGSRTGVFFGLSTADYHQLVMAGGLDSIDAYTATGSAHSVAAGRLAYLLGLHGPNLALDTACSSSLVAIHMACASLRAGECELALAGGANLVLSPGVTIALSKARMLAPDGRCKTFDAAADGFVRSEGCGVLVLKLLSKAVAARDNIVAAIRGSAVNQDGRSSGLTAPNGAAQEDVIGRALEAAGLKGSELQYVEAHGTGTSLGDPIEAHALAATLGKDRAAENPLYAGSVKTNVGHLEAAAGVASVIKTVLSLWHGVIPPNLHFSRLNPHIDLNGVPVTIPVDARPWPQVERRLAGVSAFGFSGTNCHLILEAAPVRPQLPGDAGMRHTLVASARTPAALREVARRYSLYLEAHPEASLADFCYTADTGRARFEHTFAENATSVGELRTKLAAIADGRIEPGPWDSSKSAERSAGDKIVLPTYPFERQRYWVEISLPQKPAQAPPPHTGVGFYQIEWDRKPGHAGVSGREPPPTRRISEALVPVFDSLSLEHKFDRYASLAPELDKLSFDYIARALAALGWNPTPGERITTEDLAARLHVKPRHRRSFARMLEILAEEAVLEREGEAWRVLRSTATPADPAERLASLRRDYAQFRGALTLTERCGAELAGVLQGRSDPLNLLFPDGSLDTAEDIYENSAGARVFQTLVQQSITRALEQFPPGRKIRILEVGAGTGGTTSYLADVLPAERTEYVFTDVSKLFTTRAAKKFQKYPFFRFEVLDIERDPESQGFTPHGFDFVIASNCLHATKDLRLAVSHVAKLLAPSGMLILLEATRPERWVDITFSLVDGWWRFTDTGLRPTYPLISRTKWEKLLAETGFRDVASLPHDPQSPNVLLLAGAPKPQAGGHASRSWTIIADLGGMASLVVDRLKERGERAVVMPPGNPLPVEAGQRTEILDLAALDTPAAEDLTRSDWANVQRFGCERILSIAQALAAGSSARPARLWVVTRDTQCVDGNDGPRCIAAAPVWGLGRTISLEHPEIWGGLIDLNPSESLEHQAAQLVNHLCEYDGEDQVAFRRGTRYVPRLRPRMRTAVEQPAFRDDASYLITGGLGRLGLLVAQWMVEHGARHLILAGRHGVTSEPQSAALRKMEKLGASIRVAPTDITDEAQTGELFSTIASQEPPLRGVIHAALAWGGGRTRPNSRDDSISGMQLETMKEILLPKVKGTWLLHQETRNLPLDFFCLFSSGASLGSRHLGHYAAASQFLNAFAQFRRSIGLPAVSIAWGAWDEVSAFSEEARDWFHSSGVLPMPAQEALLALGELLNPPEASVMVANIDWQTLKPMLEGRRKRPLLESIELDPPHQAEPAAAIAARQHWEDMAPAGREKRLMSLVWEETCQALQIEPGAPLEPDRGFFEMGMDSLVSVEMKTRLESRLGRVLPSMLTFNYPTVRSLSARLLAELSADSPTKPGAAPGPVSTVAMDDEEVARLLAQKLRSLQLQTGNVSPR